MKATVQWLASLCRHNLLTEKWLLVSDLRVGNQWKDQLNLAGVSTINLHAKTPRSLGLTLISGQLAERRLLHSAHAMNSMLVREILEQLRREGKLRHLGASGSQDGLAELLARSFHDLRLAAVAPDSLPPSAFESVDKAADLRLLYERFIEELGARNLVDQAGCIQSALGQLRNRRIQLPAGLLLMLPEKLQLSYLENELLDTLGSLSQLVLSAEASACSVAELQPHFAKAAASDESRFRFTSAVGEANEVRGVFEQLFASETPSKSLDEVEILHSDASTFVPIIVEQLSTWLADLTPQTHRKDRDESENSLLDLPVTFSEGIPAIYSRPGRALRGWLRWIGSDYVQTRAVQLVREGLLVKPELAEDVGYARLANTLRKIPIGFGLERYNKKLDEAIRSARKKAKEYEERGDREHGTAPEIDLPKRDFGLASLYLTRAMLAPLIELCPSASDPAPKILAAAKTFLLKLSRADNKLDRAARNQLLDEIDSMRAALEVSANSDFDVRRWLEELPVSARFASSGPRPGCVHVAPIARGGYSGRPQLFIIGLDDHRFPVRPAVDPILLDSERRRISDKLILSELRATQANQGLWTSVLRALELEHSRVTVSYSVRNLAEERMGLPSSAMLDLFRESTGDPAKHLDDLIAHTSPSTAFVSRKSDRHLSETDRGLCELLQMDDSASRCRQLGAWFPHLHSRRIAREALEDSGLSAFEGYVPAAGDALDPTKMERVSASKLETYGACPRRYFFSYGLGIHPPDEWLVDSDTWLDALQFGNLVHELLEDFLRELTHARRTPSVARDRDSLMAMLDRKIEERKSDQPVCNQNAFRLQCEQLVELCEIFLEKEEAYCRDQRAVPWVLEASLGMRSEQRTDLDCDDPIPLALSDGRIIKTCGRVDRMDKLTHTGSERYAIWDYKSGSTFGYQSDNPFPQGRKLQPFLYFGMLRRRISDLGGDSRSVASFGYFFPNPSAGGIRMEWTEASLKSGDEVLRHICDSIASGVFVATTEKDDCKYCHYQAICGDPEVTAPRSLWKAQQSCNAEPLKQLRILRNID